MITEMYSFFSGVGLLDLGFENAGFSIAFVNEYNKCFLDAYKYARKNTGNIPKYGYNSDDIRDFLSNEKWNSLFPDYNNRTDKLIGFIGGPPCPDFSTAGKNAGKDGKNGHLTSVYIDLIIKRKPDFFIFENVKGLYRTKKHREFYESLKTKLNKAGYCLFDSIENSLEYGVPQFRERLFLIGFRTKSFSKNVHFDFKTHKKYDLVDIVNKPWPKRSCFLVDNQLPHPDGIIDDLTVEYWFAKNNVEDHPNGKDFFAVKALDKFKNIEEGATTGKSFKRLHRWRYAPTSAYGNNEVHLHPYKLRRLSVAEAMAIQSAPPVFSLPSKISLSAKFKMIGNGVPVLLAQGVANSVMDTLIEFAKEF